MRNLRNIVHEMTSDCKLVEKLESWMDEKIPSLSLIKSLANLSVQDTQNLIQVSSSSSSSSFDNVEDALKPKFYPQLPTGNAHINRKSSKQRHDIPRDNDVFDESHEIIIVPRNVLTTDGQDDIDEMCSSNSDSVDNKLFFILGEKIGTTPFISTPSINK
jgi:hypothetical protein